MLRASVRRYSIKNLPFESKPKNKYNEARSAFNLKPVPTQGLIHNPPASMPSVIDTPKAFLPRNDPRLKYMAEKFKTYTAEELEDMPLIWGAKKDYSLTPDIIQEIITLRNQDPHKWSIAKLAAKFGVATNKVNVITGFSMAKQQKILEELQAVKESWSDKRKIARDDRQRRKQMWLRNEY
ncbi:putative mitochondrial 54S ribosomal protein [Clavispora lusitaniae]|uniref:Mitochondrial 54S ribosomal protein n=1 Tax=Clavispora lusitaniae TaxID=36911 RepID=A0AA91Q2W5_CLALS|nr:putative mitochondrial 54S ribosomal protein [Clavispora lusitaniae]